MNRSEIATAVREHCRAYGTRDVTPTVMLNSIAKAGRKLNRDTKLYRGWGSLMLQTGVQEYDLSGTFGEVFRAELGDSRIKLNVTTMDGLDAEKSGWRSATAGTVTDVWFDGQMMGVHPKPAVATTIYLRTVLPAPGLSSSASVPNWLPADHHDALVFGTAIQILAGHDADEDGAANRFQSLYTEYLSEINDLKQIANRRNRSTGGTIRPLGYDVYTRRTE